MAQILTSLSGLQFSAAAAPTNSADVSAIASAYQVVSATATQLYAGTAYVTSVNDNPLSAARAGNAANASLANSAWYDGTGRLISALPDSAAVSAIVSSYVESGVSGKQDTLSFAYNTADQISSINGSALGGMDEAAVSGIASAYAESAASSKLDTTAFNSGDFYTTANESGFVDSAYVDSAVSGKANASALSSYYTTANESGFITGVDLTDYATTAYVDSAVSSKADTSALSSYVPYSSLEYNTASAISGINGSALAAGSTYSAGEGIDITDDVISVDAPVDIVAGPGIVIDNPDGNTLRVSMAADYEVELYKHTTVAYTNVNDVYTMSEPITNFERIRIEFWNREFHFMRISFEYYVTDAVADSTQFVAALDASTGTDNIQRVNMVVGFNSSGNLVDKFHGLFYFNGGNYTNASDRGLGIHRVVGIHRINGGN